MVAMAQLLHMRIPNSYEVAFPESPGRGVPDQRKSPAELQAPGMRDTREGLVLKTVHSEQPGCCFMCCEVSRLCVFVIHVYPVLC